MHPVRSTCVSITCILIFISVSKLHQIKYYCKKPIYKFLFIEESSLVMPIFPCRRRNDIISPCPNQQHADIPPPHSKVANLGFCFRKLRIVLKPMENNFLIFSFWDMVDFLLKMIRKLTKISPKLANFFKIKRCVLFWSLWKNNFMIFTILNFWDMVDFVLKIHMRLVKKRH